MPGRVASLVLRCIDYHILQCVKAGWKDEEHHQAFNLRRVVGGSIVIPHPSDQALRAKSAPRR